MKTLCTNCCLNTLLITVSPYNDTLFLHYPYIYSLLLNLYWNAKSFKNNISSKKYCTVIMERTNLVESKLKELREVWIWTKIFAYPRPVLIVCLFYKCFVFVLNRNLQTLSLSRIVSYTWLLHRWTKWPSPE